MAGWDPRRYGRDPYDPYNDQLRSERQRHAEEMARAMQAAQLQVNPPWLGWDNGIEEKLPEKKKFFQNKKLTLVLT